MKRIMLAFAAAVTASAVPTSAGADYPDDCFGMEKPSAADCGHFTAEGCCDALGRLVYCDGGKLYCIDCLEMAPFCGWVEDEGSYWCGTDGGADPSGVNPKDCFICDPPCGEGEICTGSGCQVCIPDCTGKMCGPNGCGGLCGECEGECIDWICQQGEGCEVSDEKGCNGCACEKCVCEMDSYCCKYQWDSICVYECIYECGGCFTPPNCGDEHCIIEEFENCKTCPEDCGCTPPDVCFKNVCCTPACEDKECGDDGCGGSCGKCAGICDEHGLCYDGLGCLSSWKPGCPGCPCEKCVCQLDPSCCSDSWHGSCAEMCLYECGGCPEMLNCGDGNCNPDEYENCGTCPDDCKCLPGQVCFDGTCCTPACEGKECGDDGCGGSCGKCKKSCPNPEQCIDGQCIPCQPHCEGKECGDDGCGCSCGECEVGICDDGKCNVGLGCVTTDTPGCPGCPCEKCVCEMDPYCCEYEWDTLCTKECFNDCGGCYQMPACGDGVCTPEEYENCFTCPADCVCLEGVCLKGDCCIPQCEGKECGDDGCEGSCGGCEVGICDDGKCNVGLGCVPTDTPGCPGCPCEKCVCETYLFCCTVEWDDFCAQICLNDCGGCYQMPACGDGSCTAEEHENCFTCPADCICLEGSCVKGTCCIPQCEGKECGDDGCGGSCGECGLGEVCFEDGTCNPNDGCFETPTPGCPGCACEKCVCQMDPYCCEFSWDSLCVYECLNDCGGCGWACDPPCGPGEKCEDGVCVECLPDCKGKYCGNDGCGGVCGECPEGAICLDGLCEPAGCAATPGTAGCNGCQCEECVCQKYPYCCFWEWDSFCVSACLEECGGCPPVEIGDSCGDGYCNGEENCSTCPGDCPCPKGKSCNAGVCVECQPQCEGKECGPDGCGGLCGTCNVGYKCTPNGTCECVPACEGKECGPDGCGGVCGTCDAGYKCTPNGTCECIPACEGKECGPDGCGGECGQCKFGTCNTKGKCECTPACDGKECGDDGCGGVCGICPAGECSPEGKCVVTPPEEEEDVTAAEMNAGDTAEKGGVDIAIADGSSKTLAPPKKKKGCSAGSGGSLPELLLFLAALAMLEWRRVFGRK